MTPLEQRYRSTLARIAAAAPDREITLLAVSKTQPAAAVAALAALGQRAFGENYVQEALAKMRELAALKLEWHLIGPLQSKKCKEVAQHFDWLQSLDRAKLVPLLARHRPAEREPLNVLIQVNIDDETSKSGVAPAEIADLADLVARTQGLRLRGLMAIPHPWPEASRRREAFLALRDCFVALRQRHPRVDTLSMGMSADFELALACGATLVRVGSSLFGERAAKP